MKTASEYIDSLRQRDIRLFLRGEQIAPDAIVDHPMIAPSIRAIAESYRLANIPEWQPLLTAHSSFIDVRVNRFTHIFEQPGDLLKKIKMQRVLGRITGTCFQRCVGMDAINAVYNSTYEIDQAEGTKYHARFLEYLKHVQSNDLVLCGAMTDPKGDRRKAPHQQQDMFLRVTEHHPDYIVVNGAKMHQTGVVNAHEIIVMPGRSMTPEDADFAVSFAVPVDTTGITMIYGRKPNDDRRYNCSIDQGNARYGNQEAIVIFENVKVPIERVFMFGETQHTTALVDYFAGYHRQSYGGCKPGNGDVLIGAAALAAQINGVEKASHIREKLVEMVQLNETMHGCGIACSTQCTQTPAGSYMVDLLLANVTKQNVTRNPYEMARLAEDIAGGLLVTLPAEEDINHPEYGEIVKKYITGATGSAEDHQRVLRLIETMTTGETAAAFRTESMHGAGSPQAQRVRIATQADFVDKISLAKRIAGIDDEPQIDSAEDHFNKINFTG
jgi:4-hydroxybutyryl-CoA dehydratase / vinylacetyl-CoA-Delta-isomerase